MDKVDDSFLEDLDFDESRKKPDLWFKSKDDVVMFVDKRNKEMEIYGFEDNESTDKHEDWNEYTKIKAKSAGKGNKKLDQSEEEEKFVSDQTMKKAAQIQALLNEAARKTGASKFYSVDEVISDALEELADQKKMELKE